MKNLYRREKSNYTMVTILKSGHVTYVQHPSVDSTRHAIYAVRKSGLAEKVYVVNNSTHKLVKGV